MRMFLIGMTDIFLILYLTAITSVPSTSVLTVDDFFKLKTMHETLVEEKEDLTVQLTEEQARLQNLQESLLVSDEELARINKDLQLKENMLKSREQLMKELNQKIESKEL